MLLYCLRNCFVSFQYDLRKCVEVSVVNGVNALFLFNSKYRGFSIQRQLNKCDIFEMASHRIERIYIYIHCAHFVRLIGTTCVCVFARAF